MLIIGSLVAVCGLVLSVVFTNPMILGPLGVTVWFVVLFLGLSSVLTLGLYTAKTFLHLHLTSAARLSYSWRQGLLGGGWASGVLALSSLRQLGALDAILLALLLVIIEVYVRFRWP